MKKALTKIAFIVAAVTTLAACSNTPATKAEPTVTLTAGALAGEQLVNATLWVQKSAEYRALAYQAFNSAQRAFILAKNVRGKTKAVIVDLDETMIDNSEYQGSVVKTGVPFNSKDWGKWEQAGKPSLIPGALAFVKYVYQNGGRVFYVSNRQHTNLKHTIATLKELGFPQVSEENVLLKDKVSDKNPRFQSVASKYNVVVQVGDNLVDFPSTYSLKTPEARNQWVDANKALFGSKYIVLPNPMYGSWLSTLQPGFYSKSLTEQNKVKVELIKAWDASNFK